MLCDAKVTCVAITTQLCDYCHAISAPWIDMLEIVSISAVQKAADIAPPSPCVSSDRYIENQGQRLRYELDQSIPNKKEQHPI